jgi:hypothetical protein
VLDKKAPIFCVVVLIIVTVHLACDQGALDLGNLLVAEVLREQVMSQLLWQRQAHVLDALRVQKDVVARTHEGEKVFLVRPRESNELVSGGRHPAVLGAENGGREGKTGLQGRVLRVGREEGGREAR